MFKVLIVEDEEIIRKGLVYTIDWLSMDCMVVGEAASGKQGLAMLERYEPDIVLVDIIMPEMSGIEMLKAAQELKIKQFKSIILTSYANFDYARQAVKLQAADYLLKPVDEDELKKTIDRVKTNLAEARAFADVLALSANNGGEELVDWNAYLNKDTLKNRYVAKTLYKIRDHYNEKISIESIAEELQVSASYLSRKFKEATSCTFLELLMRYRIQKAISLLKQGNYRMYEVSDLTGFSDYKHFCVVFKKFTNISPSEFVKNLNCIINR